MPPRTWAIVVAAGSGARFGAAKQFLPLAGRPVLDRSVDAARSVAEGVVVVVPAERCATAVAGADAVVAGAATRSGSVRAGLAAVPADAEVVVVHDAARPLAPPALFHRVVDEVASGRADCALPGLAISDTVKRVDPSGVVEETLDRSRLVLVQTPQAFAAGALRRAHAGRAEATDDAALIEAAGGRVVVVPGEPGNLKITHPADLVVAEALLEAGR